MPITDLQKSAIARTLVGAERGTAFLVTKDLLLTALHCVARLVPSRPEGFEKLGPDILVRFGDPKGQPRDTGKATLIAANVEDDVALLRCATPPTDVQPLPLGQTSTWARPLEWETFGFPEMSGRVASDGPEVWGQALHGEVASIGPKLQLTLRSHALLPHTTLGGVSGAPILVGGLVMGLALQELQSNGSTVQNTLFGRHLELICSPGRLRPVDGNGVPSLPWPSEPPDRQRGALEAALAKGFHIQDLRPVAKKLEVPGDVSADGTARALLTCDLDRVVDTINKSLGRLPAQFDGPHTLALLLCSARLPSFVRAEVAPALAPESRVQRRAFLGGTDAEARTVAYTFALDEDAGADEAAERIVALSLPGLEGSEGLERLFREVLSKQVLFCEDDELDEQLQAWRDWKRDVYVIVEGLPPHDFAERLASVYERVRVVVWGRPALAIGAQPSGEPFLERCVPEHLEPHFQRAFAFLKSKRR